MHARGEWSAFHIAAWKGHQATLVRLLRVGGAPTASQGQSPLYLALSRWGCSSRHQGMIQLLWQADPAPHLARWGDTAWGGGLTLLDLVVQKDLPLEIDRCKQRGIEPHERTWSMALIHDSDRPLLCLGLAFEPPDYLPGEMLRVQRMLSERQAMLLAQDASEGAGNGTARRL